MQRERCSHRCLQPRSVSKYRCGSSAIILSGFSSIGLLLFIALPWSPKQILLNKDSFALSKLFSNIQHSTVYVIGKSSNTLENENRNSELNGDDNFDSHSTGWGNPTDDDNRMSFSGISEVIQQSQHQNLETLF